MCKAAVTDGLEARVVALARSLGAVLPADRVRRHDALAAHTTFRLGGPADLLVSVRTEAEAIAVAAAAREAGVPVVALGGGSNVLVSDRGVRGLVLRFHGGDIDRAGDGVVRAGAGVTINGLVRWLIGQGLAGLEAWAGTPGTVGGAIFGNAHFQGRLISESVSEVRVLRPDGGVVDVPAGDMDFAYDYSRLHDTGELVLSATFRVRPGEPDALRAVARASLAFRKRTQPLHLASAGCIFQNPAPDEPLPPDMPRSAGALIDRAGCKGLDVGGAAVSEVHANFIVATPQATAAAVRGLIERCRHRVADAFDVRLRDEVVYLGEWERGSGEPS